MILIIVNKGRNDAYNINHVTNFYIGSDGCSIKVSAGSATRGGILGKYSSYEETRKAFEILLDGIARNDTEILYMPSDTEVTGKLKAQPQQAYHHITGKKTKGHGGS